MDNVEEANGISHETNCIFLHTFIKYGSTILYQKWVLDPTLNTHVASHERLFKLAGFNVFIGSVDVIHIGMLNYATWDHIIYFFLSSTP